MLGLALEGGGARAAAHVGVLRALAEGGIAIGSVAGTSAGSPCAAAYALRGSAEDARQALEEAADLGLRLLDLNLRGLVCGMACSILHQGRHTMGLFKGDRLLRWVDGFTQSRALSQTSVPLAIPSVDLVSGDIYAFSSRMPQSEGSYRWDTGARIAEAVRASCSLPGVFCPYAYKGALLVDGGVLENLPVRVLRRQGTRRVLGVVLDVEGEMESPPHDIIGVGLRVIQIVQPHLMARDERKADLLLRIKLPKGSGLFSMREMRSFEEIGYETARASMVEIRRLALRSESFSQKALA